MVVPVCCGLIMDVMGAWSSRVSRVSVIESSRVRRFGGAVEGFE